MENFKIIHGDCIEEMKKMPSKSVDCIITDPPFFMPASHYASRITYQRNYGDLTPLKVFWEVITKELRRILKDDGHLFVFCNCDSYPVFYEPTYNNFDKVKSLVWDKTRVGLGRIFRNQHELIIWARMKEHKFIQDGKLRADVLKFPATLSKDRVHPVEKPVQLLRELILATTNEGDVVFDAFMGGGSTLLACKETNRKGIGIDISKEYCDLVVERLSKEVQTRINTTYRDNAENTKSELNSQDVSSGNSEIYGKIAEGKDSILLGSHESTESLYPTPDTQIQNEINKDYALEGGDEK